MKRNVTPLRPETTWATQWRNYISTRQSTTGRKCLDLMKQRAACGSARLSRPDREKIAAALFFEIKRLKQAKSCTKVPFTTAAWMETAKLADDEINPTKRLNEYVMDPYSLSLAERKGRVKRLKGNFSEFANLIESLFEFTDEDPDAVCHRIFLGTSLQGVEVDVNQHRHMASSLMALVEKIDKLPSKIAANENLETLFARTAKAKEEIQRVGALTNWPYFDLNEPNAACHAEHPNWEKPYWANDDAIFHINEFSDPLNGTMLITSLNWLDALMYLPRVYLGCAVYFPDWNIDPAMDTQKAAERFASMERNHKDLFELRALGTGLTEVTWRDQGAILHRADSIPRITEGYDPGFREPDEEGHCWLVIYPHPRRRGLCPMLYWPQGEGGVHVCPLDENTIYTLSHIYVSSGPGGSGVLTLFDRAQQILTDIDKPLEFEWAKTAFDILKNPVLISQKTCAAGMTTASTA